MSDRNRSGGSKNKKGAFSSSSKKHAESNRRSRKTTHHNHHEDRKYDKKKHDTLSSSSDDEGTLRSAARENKTHHSDGKYKREKTNSRRSAQVEGDNDVTHDDDVSYSDDFFKIIDKSKLESWQEFGFHKARVRLITSEYFARDAHELNVYAGEKVRVLNQDGEMWRVQKPDGSKGLVPRDCFLVNCNKGSSHISEIVRLVERMPVTNKISTSRNMVNDVTRDLNDVIGTRDMQYISRFLDDGVVKTPAFDYTIRMERPNKNKTK